MVVKLDVGEKRISPAAATMVLVALTMAATVAISYSLGRMLRSYMVFEKLEVVGVFVEYDCKSGCAGWNITLMVRNSGSADATINNVLVNGKPLAEYSGSILAAAVGISIPAGEQRAIELYIKAGELFRAGSSVEVRLYSTSGRECFSIINLPHYPRLLSHIVA